MTAADLAWDSELALRARAIAPIVSRGWPSMRNATDIVASDLADENAALRAHVASLLGDVNVYRDLLSTALSHTQHLERLLDRQRETIRQLMALDRPGPRR